MTLDGDAQGRQAPAKGQKVSRFVKELILISLSPPEIFSKNEYF